MSKTKSNNIRRRTRRRDRTNPSQGEAVGGFAAQGGSAAPSISQKKRKNAQETPEAPVRKKKKVDLTGKEIVETWKEGRLAPLADIPESLSRQITTVIESTANSMLDLYLEIAQRKIALNRFDTLIKNKKTEAEELFAPSCCRIKNPVTGSRLVKDLDEYKTIVATYQELVDSYKEQARTLLKDAAKLEVSSREKALQKLAFQSLIKVLMNIVIEEFVRDKTEEREHALPKEVIAYQAARQYVLSLDGNIRLALKFNSA